MAHFAKLDSNNVVLSIHRVNNDIATDETAGINFLKKLYNWQNWKQCSYNTRGGVHKTGGTAFRKNYPTIGSTYDSTKDAFILPKPFSSWTLNSTTCLYEPTIDYPTDGKIYEWDESTTSWVEQSLSEE